MVKQEVLKVIADLRIAQNNQDKFVEHYKDFCSVPRCKKGIVEFLKELRGDELSDAPWIFHDVEQVLKLKMVSQKSNINSDLLWDLLNRSTYNDYKAKELRKQRESLLRAVGEYLMFIHSELDKSTLVDNKERQVYLRRAIARLATVLASQLIVPIALDQWHEVEPNEYIDYLLNDLNTLVGHFTYGENPDTKYGSIWYDWYGLNKPNTIDSIESFLDYVDGFLVY